MRRSSIAVSMALGLVLGSSCVLAAGNGAADGERKESTAMTADACPPALNYRVKSIDGGDVDLCGYKGNVLLVVNVASKCGLTPQYEGLEALNKKYRERGLRVLGFPANNFAGQEPGSNEEIKQFCSLKYNVSFDMFSKISVKGDDAAEFYKNLTAGAGDPALAGEIKWNFQKYLIDRNGKVVAVFGPKTDPMAPEVTAAIEKLL
jgi:glutathione peroxidase